MIEGPRLLLGSGVLQSSLVSYSCFWLLNFLWDKAPPWLFFLDEKTSFYLEEKSLKPPFVWKVKISFTKAVLTIPQLLQNQKSYKKEKPVILHFPSSYFEKTRKIRQNSLKLIEQLAVIAFCENIVCQVTIVSALSPWVYSYVFF